MTERDQPTDGHYGFARVSDAASEERSAPVRLVYSGERDSAPAPAEKPPAPAEAWKRREPEIEPASRSSRPRTIGSDDGRWVVRPKTPVSELGPSPRLLRSMRSRSAALAQGQVTPSIGDTDEPRSKHWLALGLAAMVYVTGVAGLWSMIQTFDETAPASITPTGGEAPLPPLDDEIDVRDARLDDPFLPALRPDAPPATENDLAASNLQKQS